ncbi:MAG TPA: hypothetical protein VIM70_03675 [Clostridium sp.]|uniref:hypothetical protein n=1 Tax=Clostridium sp. TaxID=1506 RepID=UPI002F93A49E
MFYNNRKTIYISLIIIAIILSFLCGKKIGNGATSNKEITKTAVENVHYNDILSVKGNDYSVDYSITNALFLDESSMQFNLTMQNNENVNTIRVVAKDQDNNTLNIDTNVSDDKKLLRYTVKLDSNTTTISIYVYPLTKVMAANQKLILDTIPFKSSKLYVSLLKQQQIQKLQN